MAFYIYDMLNILLEEKFAMAYDQYGIIPEQLFQVFTEQASFVIWCYQPDLVHVVIIPWFIASWLSKLNQQKQNYLMYSNWRGQLNKTKIQYKKLFTNNKKIISFLTILLFDIYKMLYMTGNCWNIAGINQCSVCFRDNVPLMESGLFTLTEWEYLSFVADRDHKVHPTIPLLRHQSCLLLGGTADPGGQHCTGGFW